VSPSHNLCRPLRTPDEVRKMKNEKQRKYRARFVLGHRAIPFACAPEDLLAFVKQAGVNVSPPVAGEFTSADLKQLGEGLTILIEMWIEGRVQVTRQPNDMR
jgi:hypothetical protein